MELFVAFKSPLISLGRYTVDTIKDLGRIAMFFSKGFLLIFTRPVQFNKILQQVYFIGMKSVFVVCLTGAFTGMVLGLQGYYLLIKYGSTGVLGSAVALSLIGFSKPGASHPVPPATIGAIRAPVFYRLWR